MIRTIISIFLVFSIIGLLNSCAVYDEYPTTTYYYSKPHVIYKTYPYYYHKNVIIHRHPQSRGRVYPHKHKPHSHSKPNGGRKYRKR